MGVTGMGGLFFRAKDPEALTAWYREHFGFGGGDSLWEQQAGPTVFAPFKADSDYFAADKAFMINLRVDDLDAMKERLAAAGIEVITDPEWDMDGSYGHFARVHDPEGNAIELWEPPAEMPEG
ncbi:VOC family protein [uncultured Parasphingopyxis sp.]|uniref:VOC family protein n=1 Tax=uncultured Parasphingopyxis sp. TaxID=1547918 RepID=UPI00260D10C5|nr:VOC family protein [uncultured Parasphingopyxis sp.]